MMYKLIKTDELYPNSKCVIRILDNAFIPFDPDNTDFIEYQKWLAAGNTPLPADE